MGPWRAWLLANCQPCTIASLADDDTSAGQGWTLVAFLLLSLCRGERAGVAHVVTRAIARELGVSERHVRRVLSKAIAVTSRHIAVYVRGEKGDAALVKVDQRSDFFDQSADGLRRLRWGVTGE